MNEVFDWYTVLVLFVATVVVVLATLRMIDERGGVVVDEFGEGAFSVAEDCTNEYRGEPVEATPFDEATQEFTLD